MEQELSDLQNTLTILAESRSDVLQKLNESSSRKDIQKALRSAKNYQADLVEKTSGDEQLMDSIRKAQERVEELGTALRSLLGKISKAQQAGALGNGTQQHLRRSSSPDSLVHFLS